MLCRETECGSDFTARLEMDRLPPIHPPTPQPGCGVKQPRSTLRTHPGGQGSAVTMRTSLSSDLGMRRALQLPPLSRGPVLTLPPEVRAPLPLPPTLPLRTKTTADFHGYTTQRLTTPPTGYTTQRLTTPPTGYTTQRLTTPPTGYTTQSLTTPTGYTTQSLTTPPTGYTTQSLTTPTGYTTQSLTTPTGYTTQSLTTPTGYTTQSLTTPTGYTTQSLTTPPTGEDVRLSLSSGDWRPVKAFFLTTFSSFLEVNAAFKREANGAFDTIDDSGVNTEFVYAVYDALLNTPPDVQKSVLKGIINSLLREWKG
ncbi:unnamed protein product [Arctogadus glacialis]